MEPLASVATILQILTLAEKHGIPFVQNLLSDLNKEVLTLEDIQKITNDIKPFEEYFPGVEKDE